MACAINDNAAHLQDVPSKERDPHQFLLDHKKPPARQNSELRKGVLHRLVFRSDQGRTSGDKLLSAHLHGDAAADLEQEVNARAPDA